LFFDAPDFQQYFGFFKFYFFHKSITSSVIWTSIQESTTASAFEWLLHGLTFKPSFAAAFR
jgi:hypothetical protein